ncbi:MAG: zinc ribbon domain-containing protein [Saccharofermentans sp.]|nr:zinc ribbon domain-containing protein [Saccharofermentans sp.]
MPFCSKCGNELNVEDIFCSKCGFRSDFNEDADAAAAQDTSVDRPAMTKEESIALAEKLSKDYKALERLNKDISDNETILSRPADYQFRPHSAFKFFWPYLIYAAIAFWILYFLFVFIASGTSSAGVLIVGMLCLCSPVILLIVGGVKAFRSREEANAAESEEIRRRKVDNENLKKRTDELRLKRTVITKRLSDYNQIVPPALRTSTRMEKSRVLIQTGKAEDFYDAIDFQLKHLI